MVFFETFWHFCHRLGATVNTWYYSSQIVGHNFWVLIHASRMGCSKGEMLPISVVNFSHHPSRKKKKKLQKLDLTLFLQGLGLGIARRIHTHLEFIALLIFSLQCVNALLSPGHFKNEYAMHNSLLRLFQWETMVKWLWNNDEWGMWHTNVCFACECLVDTVCFWSKSYSYFIIILFSKEYLFC